MASAPTMSKVDLADRLHAIARQVRVGAEGAAQEARRLLNRIPKRRVYNGPEPTIVRVGSDGGLWRGQPVR